MIPNANSGTFLNITVFLLSSVVLTKQIMNSMEQSFLEKLTGAQQIKKFPIFYGT